jgi:hypothetical protein
MIIMKYILLLLFAACTRPESRKGELIFGKDSVGETKSRIRSPWDTSGNVQLADSPQWRGTGKYYHFVMKLEGAMLGVNQDSTITITGDTMKIVKGLLVQLGQLMNQIEDMQDAQQVGRHDSVAYYTRCIDSLSYYERLIDKYTNIAKEAQSRSVNRRTMETDFKQMNKATEYWLKASLCRVRKGMVSSKIDDYFARSLPHPDNSPINN